MDQEYVFLYSDGACEGNPGKGGYGAIFKYGDKEELFSKGFLHTTNNRMELLGIIEPLEEIYENTFLKNNSNKMLSINIVSDSQYVVNAINKKWLINWQKNNWKKADGKKVLNRDLWERLSLLMEKYDLNFIWTRGHSSNEYNNRCDVLAVDARKKDRLEKDLGYKPKRD